MGTALLLFAVLGPPGRLADDNFGWHMIVHLLLGMIVPLLFAVGAPVSLLLRVVDVRTARRVTRVLRSLPVRVLTEPVVAAALDIGGLWLIYRTGILAAMHHHLPLHLAVHVHLVLAGFLFTATLVDADPLPHRRSHLYRALVLLVAIAAHDLLAKSLYADPPAMVPAGQAEAGAMIMYYGGDVVHLVVLVLLCAHWYRAARPTERVRLTA
jgi:putative membrane protein